MHELELVSVAAHQPVERTHGQQLVVQVAKLEPVDAAPRHVVDAKSSQCSAAVRPNCEPRSDLRRCWASLENLDLVPDLPERDGSGKACDATACDQHLHRSPTPADSPSNGL